jgi:hypothetical protein
LDSLVAVDHSQPADRWTAVDREPTDVVDRLLWRDAQQMLRRHAASDERGLCVWCSRAWPCAPRRLAERAENAAFKPWNEAWTARHDLHSLRATPSWRADLRTSSPDDPPARHARNPGLFD